MVFLGLFFRFLGALLCCLWCGSTWFVVRIKYVDRALRRKKFRKKKETIVKHILLQLLIDGKLCARRRSSILEKTMLSKCWFGACLVVLLFGVNRVFFLDVGFVFHKH
jgi:hypothetical protein